jgi:cytoskeleton protein RodZ
MAEPEAEPGLVQIGETLRAAREVRGLSLEQAALRLRCDVRVIERLEAGRFDELGPPVFARGHLLRYAEMLGESGDAMITAWAHAAAGTSAAGELMSDTHPRRTRDLRQIRRRLVAGTAILCVAIVVLWSLQQLGSRPTVEVGTGAASDEVQAVVPAAAPATTTIVANGGPAAGDSAVQGPHADLAAPVVTAPPAAAPAAAPSTAVPQAVAAPAASRAPTAQLAVIATADSWLEIYDRRNRRLFFGVARPGALVDVRGSLPLRVVVGNVPATTFELDGRRVEVPREAMRGRRAATFRVGPDGRLSAWPRA